MDLDQAEKLRDMRLRRRLLQALHAARRRPEFGWVRGRFIHDVVNGALPGGQEFDGDDHMLALMRDLAAGGHVEERDDRIRAGEPYGLDSLSFRITNQGSALVLQAIEPDPLVEDDRLRPARTPRAARRSIDR